jgi:GNAT superfamily N-acetyltransferase
MNSTDGFRPECAKEKNCESDVEHVPGKFDVRVKVLSERDRRALMMHFLGLNEHDRLLRFGSAMPDELITRYVQKMNFSRDVMLGIYDDRKNLAGVGHLAYVPRETIAAVADVTAKGRVAELALSVLVAMRGFGIASRLFERAIICCRTAEIDILYMHCLVSNDPIMHIAKKAGMKIQHDGAEVDTYLKLPAMPAGANTEGASPPPVLMH